MEKGKTFYDFQFNTRLVKSTIVHFQVEPLFMFSFNSSKGIDEGGMSWFLEASVHSRYLFFYALET